MSHEATSSNKQQVVSELIEKYDVPAPRYTSYPTVPHWNRSPSESEWITSIEHTLNDSNAFWSLYIHVPFCETLCTFCGCNNSITKNKTLGLPYVNTILDEFKIYLEKTPLLKKRILKSFHIGGGTPTFLSPDELRFLIESILSNCTIDQDFEGSIEVDPRRTSEAHLKVLVDSKFNRISLGVQDLDPEVQYLINRNQSIEQTRKITELANQMGFHSINWDLIYGLPKQTLQKFDQTIELTLQMRPNRIALYSFALVPWIKPQQRLFKDEDLPVGVEKRQLYEHARSRLISGGYLEVGMDHFALPTDALAKAAHQKKLHRNFMGYTDQKTDLLLGLGVSAISESKDCFHQNEKILTQYQKFLTDKKLPSLRGHLLSAEELKSRKQILELMTRLESTFLDEVQKNLCLPYLQELRDDGLISFDEKMITVTQLGKTFLRNICMVFDPLLPKESFRSKGPKMFSRSI